MAATTCSNTRLARRLEHVGRAVTPRRPHAPHEPDLRLLFVAELHLLELLIAVELQRLEAGSEHPEVAQRAADELCQRASCRRHLTRRERAAAEHDDELLNTRNVVIHTHADRLPPLGQIPCHRHHRQVFTMPMLSSTTHLPRWHFDLATSTGILPWATSVAPSPGPIWSPFARRRWA